MWTYNPNTQSTLAPHLPRRNKIQPIYSMKNRLFSLLILAQVLAFSLSAALLTEKTEPKTNKLLYMYRIFYLPFSLDFQAGRDLDTILPYRLDEKGEPSRLVEAHELVSLDAEWTKIRSQWKAKSLLETNPVALGKSLRITQRLASHHIALNRSALDSFSPADKAAINQTLKGKKAEVVSAFYQLRFLKTFLDPSDENKFNFFIVSPNWCESSREYRLLLEAYFKKFPTSDLTLHSIIVEDPARKIFDSRVVKELFPHPKKYTHETVPRFLALQTTDGKTQIWEEGEALKEVYERFYSKHRGYLQPETKSLRATASQEN